MAMRADWTPCGGTEVVNVWTNVWQSSKDAGSYKGHDGTGVGLATYSSKATVWKP